MTLASDGKGNFLSLGQDGQWTPATRAKNPETGAELVLDGTEWKPLPGAPEPERPSTAIGAAARGAVRQLTFGLADEARAAVDALRGGNYDESLRQSRAQFEADDKQHPVASGAGQLYGGVAGAMGAGAGLRAAGLVPNALSGGLRGAAAGGALAGGATGFGEASGGLKNRLDEASQGAVVGGAVGAGVGAAAGVVGRLIAPIRPTLSAEQQALRQTAQAEGIPLRLGQETGSRTLKNMDAAFDQLPGSSALAADANAAQQRAFTAAALRRASVQSDVATPEVTNAAQARIGGIIGDIAERNRLDLEGQPNVFNAIAELEKRTALMPQNSAAPVKNWINHVMGLVDENGQIPGTAYRMTDTALGKAAKNTSDGDLRSALGELRQTLREAMDNSISPQDAAEWAQARRHYANLKVVREAANTAGEAGALGQVSPLALRGALERSVGKEAFRSGAGDLHPLSNLAQETLRKPPDSGTAGRTQMDAVLTGKAMLGGAGAGFAVGNIPGALAGAAAPFVLPGLAYRAAYSNLGRRYLTNQLAPNAVANIARAAPVVGAAAGSRVERNRLMRD